MADPFLQETVGGQPDRISDPLAFEIFVNVGVGESRVASKINAREFALVADDDRLQHALPVVGAVDVAGTQRAPFQIAELVEQEQRMIAGALVMPVPAALFLFAVGWTDARIHVEQDASWRSAAVHAVDPAAR
jgi:hypothetical protein